MTWILMMQCIAVLLRAEIKKWVDTWASLYFLRLVFVTPVLLIPFYISIKFSLLNNKANWSYLEILIPALWFYCWNLCCPFNIFWQNLSKMRKGLCSKYFSRNETFFCVCSWQQVIIPLFIYNLIIVLVTR